MLHFMPKYYLFVEWQGISALRRERHGPFNSREEAWEWWSQQIGYPRGTTVRCEEAV